MNLLAEVVRVPNAMVVRFEAPDLVVFVTSESMGNPFRRDERVRVRAGLYCEAVLRTRLPLLIPDALADEHWAASAQLERGMVSYLGLPIEWPGGDIFGTICVLDDKRNGYGLLYERLITQFRDVVQADLRALVQHNARLSAETLAKKRLEELVAARTAALTEAIEQEQLARATAESALRLRDDFLYVASHELHTPIVSQKLTLQSLLREAQKSPSGTPKLLVRAEAQCRRLERLVEDLLDVSRIQAGELELHREEVELVALSREVTARFETELAQVRSPLLWRIDGPVVGFWDRARLEQVLTCLVHNAIKYGAGQPIEVELSVLDGKAWLTVADRGIGIAPDRLPHIFERFERGVPTKNYGGLGLGLYIARQIVEALGGSIRVESKLGQGSRFTIELPIA
ncbi:GAF domain-containing sensor histidine kinase [Polyangium jinanense]|uniref:histidine kinase n=1 Tax=Polyangium jinanense TaxID=2829994 RepID=A0A9X3XCR3_9BACT|nr:GAF domain-containing sensor histidine kinase [Polyangium jinanense]MDC3986865.1 GAF domain-containing sensor histidine kinase [Polyangium jinanense]